MTMSRQHTALPTQTSEGQAWLSQHPDVNPVELERMWQLAEHARFLEEAFEADLGRVAAIRSAIEARVEGEVGSRSAGSPTPARRDRRARPRRPIPRSMRVAAMVVLLLGVGLGWWLRPITRIAPPGETLSTVLPDGSRIELNSGASLSYQRSFGWTTRRVRLAGEAYFDVSKAKAPFIVGTFNARVVVRGTRFNVRAWHDDSTQETTVVLEEGRVEVAARATPEKTVVLAPGQMSQVGTSTAAPSDPVDVDVPRALAWRTGGIVFTDQPLAVIFAELERRFDVDLHTRSEALRTERFSLFVNRADSLEALLDMICAPLACRYQATAQGFELTDLE